MKRFRNSSKIKLPAIGAYLFLTVLLGWHTHFFEHTPSDSLTTREAADHWTLDDGSCFFQFAGTENSFAGQPVLFAIIVLPIGKNEIVYDISYRWILLTHGVYFRGPPSTI